MDRIFICGELNFPRGGASSNYVQYLGMALKECGYEVHIISKKNPSYSETTFKGLIIDEITYHTDRIRRHIDYATNGEPEIRKCLLRYRLQKGDIVIVYSHTLWLHQAIQTFCRKRGIKVGAAVVEYFPKQELDRRRDYLPYRVLTDVVLPKHDFLFPISTFIEKKLSGGRAKQMVLPIMADPFEYPSRQKVPDGIRRFIFPANGKMKDALPNILLGIQKVLQNSNVNAEFHFCGVQEDAIRKTLGLPDGSALDSSFVLHSWMEYGELVALYQKMDFLLLARDINQMTEANFPSKVPEIMCYGVIPVASRVGDYTRFYLKDGVDSIIMDGCSPEEIQAAISHCLALSPESLLDLSRNARLAAENTFWYKNWAQKIGTFLADI